MVQEEALQLNHPYIGTEHLLPGLMRKEKSEALASMGINLGDARRSLVEAVSAETSRGSMPVSRPAAPKNNVVTCQLDDAAVGALDAPVEAGIRSTRSDAATWLINAGIEAYRELFDRVNSTVNEIRKLRLEARQIARQVGHTAANNGAEEEDEKKAPDTDTEDNGESDIKDVKDPEEPEDLDDLGKLDEPPTP
ncbi:MAG TPA: Clp protease N-terminal domain-containing protein [Ktedonobacterales bacterium]|nr:Clp protease N-terminal domain-containing protein [Ktedonobacterales bacterium]